jgi:hypothetical protein
MNQNKVVTSVAQVLSAIDDGKVIKALGDTEPRGIFFKEHGKLFRYYFGRVEEFSGSFPLMGKWEVFNPIDDQDNPPLSTEPLNTQHALWSAILDGKKVKNSDYPGYLIAHNDEIFYVIGESRSNVLPSISEESIKLGKWRIYNEPERQWHENIPADGVLCRVSQKENGPSTVVTVYKKIPDWFVGVFGQYFKFAEPITADEALYLTLD